jgi:hypothetical protein
MAAPDDLFGQLRADRAAAAAASQGRDASLEEASVKAILRYCGVPIVLHAALRDAEQQTGERRLSFTWFHNSYPRFPVKLYCRKLAFTSGTHIGWTGLFGRGFMKLPWVKEYIRVVETNDLDIHNHRIAVIFNAPHAASAATMVIHNHPNALVATTPDLRDEPETRIIRPFGTPRVTYVTESLRSFCTTVGKHWTEL